MQTIARIADGEKPEHTMVTTRSRAATVSDKPAGVRMHRKREPKMGATLSSPTRSHHGASLSEQARHTQRNDANSTTGANNEEATSAPVRASALGKRARVDAGACSPSSAATEAAEDQVYPSGAALRKRARVENEPCKPLPIGETGAGAASIVARDASGARSAKILHDASARLVWSRVDEVEGLKMSLEELGRAIRQVEDVRKRIEDSVARDLASVVQVAATRLPGSERGRSEQSFSKIFYALIGHLLPTSPVPRATTPTNDC